MRSVLLLAAVSVVLLAAVSSDTRLASPGQPVDVVVTNFPAVQQIVGAVTVTAPIPQTRLETLRAQVTPAGPSEINDLTDAGLLDATGFSGVMLSLAGTSQGRLSSVGRVGALLIPDQPEILAAFHDLGTPEFPLAVEARVAPSDSGIFQSAQIGLRLGFPRYRVFLYNTTPRTSQVVLYAYLNNS